MRCDTKAAEAGEHAFANRDVEAAFAAYPQPLRDRLLHLRRMIFDTAAGLEGVGPLQETLKWGQPSYLTAQSKSGTTIRIDRVKSGQADYAVFVNCRTTLIETFRSLYRDELRFGGNRSVLFKLDASIPEAALRHCLALALTYRRKKPARKRDSTRSRARGSAR